MSLCLSISLTLSISNIQAGNFDQRYMLPNEYKPIPTSIHTRTYIRFPPSSNNNRKEEKQDVPRAAEYHEFDTCNSQGHYYSHYV